MERLLLKSYSISIFILLGFLSSYQVVGVAQAINKRCGENSTFTEQDEKVKKIILHLFLSVYLRKRLLLVVHSVLKHFMEAQDSGAIAFFDLSICRCHSA